MQRNISGRQFEGEVTLSTSLKYYYATEAFRAELPVSFFTGPASSDKLIDLLCTPFSNAPDAFDQRVLFESLQEAMDYQCWVSQGKMVTHASGILRVVMPAGSSIMHATSTNIAYTLEGAETKYREALPAYFETRVRHNPHSDFKIPNCPLKVFTFKPGSLDIIPIAHQTHYALNKNPAEPFKSSYHGSNYQSLWQEKFSEPYAKKIRRVFDNYANPTAGWFLSGHWNRSSESIEFCRKILLPALESSELAELTPSQIANWLRDKVKSSNINMNPQGSFMRRIYFIFEKLTQAESYQLQEYRPRMGSL